MRFNATQASFPLARRPINSIYLPLLPVYHQPKTMVCWKRLWLWKPRLAVSPATGKCLLPGAFYKASSWPYKPVRGQIKARAVTPVETAAGSNKSLTSFSLLLSFVAVWWLWTVSGNAKSNAVWSKKPSRETKSQAGWRQCKVPLGFRPSGISPLGFKAQLKAAK